MPVLYTLHKCLLKIVHKLNSTLLLLKLRALIRGSRTSHVTRPKGARLPYCLAALSRARDNYRPLALFTHDVEAAIARGIEVTMITIDI
jgi:hypothetical protein